MIGEHLEIYTFEYLLNLALSHVGDEVDKREGEVIYDAIAPVCRELEKLCEELKAVYKNTFAETAKGEYLDLRAGELGMFREPSSSAERKGYFYTDNDAPFDIPTGSRFYTANGGESRCFAATERIEAGVYRMTAEAPGSAGNGYIGNLLPLSNINGLRKAVINETIIPGEDEQTDDSLRAEYFDRLTERAFGGNIAQYRSVITKLPGVGAVQVYPVWNGGGTVKCSIITGDCRAAGQPLVNAVKAAVDPVDGLGLGLAPIGHNVTVVTPTEKVINISATVATVSGVTPAQVKAAVEAEIERYFLSVRMLWGVPDSENNYSLHIFTAQVTAAILRVNGVLNVSSLSLADTELAQTAALQELPVLGVVQLG